MMIIRSVYNLVTPKLPQNYLLKNHVDLVKNTQDLDDGVLPHINYKSNLTCKRRFKYFFQIHCH